MAIEFSLTPAQRRLQGEARAFARDVLTRVRVEALPLPTPEARFRATRPMVEAAVAAGWLRRLIPRPYGGEGEGLVDMAIVAEEFFAVDVNASLTLYANLLGLMPLFIAGTPAQRERHLAPFLAATGAPLAALCNTEPGGSANYAAPPPATGVRTTATPDGDGWLINGRKQWISSATGWDGRGADLLCVVARSDPHAPPAQGISVFAVSRPASGLVVEGHIDSLGHRAHLLPRFRLDDVRVPHESLIGPLGGGMAIVDASFTATAALVGVMGAALLRAAFDHALAFARRETRGGPCPIIDHQAVGYGLADAKGALESIRLLGYQACRAMDAQAPAAYELALHSKIVGSETAVRTITELMRLVGIDSYDHTLPLAGLLQDALALPLFDGGNVGVRRRQLHALLRDPAYDAHAIWPQPEGR
ncbi:MAG: acyl-CoA dehydrogenase family protein [Gammaproteobacteria bacterium]